MNLINMVKLVMQKNNSSPKDTIFTKYISNVKNLYIFHKFICVYEKKVVPLHSKHKIKAIVNV